MENDINSDSGSFFIYNETSELASHKRSMNDILDIVKKHIIFESVFSFCSYDNEDPADITKKLLSHPTGHKVRGKLTDKHYLFPNHPGTRFEDSFIHYNIDSKLTTLFVLRTRSKKMVEGSIPCFQTTTVVQDICVLYFYGILDHRGLFALRRQ